MLKIKASFIFDWSLTFLLFKNTYQGAVCTAQHIKQSGGAKDGRSRAPPHARPRRVSLKSFLVSELLVSCRLGIAHMLMHPFLDLSGA